MAKEIIEDEIEADDGESALEKVRRQMGIQEKGKVQHFYLSTGSTLLNLAASGKVDGGFKMGTIVLLVGESDSGKTFYSLTCLAEAAANPKFSDYRFIHDAPERGSHMDMQKYYGKKMVARLEPPKTDKFKQPVYSSTLEEMYYNIENAANVGKPFIYIIDSIDTLPTASQLAVQTKNKKVVESGKGEVERSYGMERAKLNSERLRPVSVLLEKTASLLIIICQERQALNMFEDGTRAGGTALRFYSRFEFWNSIGPAIKRSINGKDRIIGNWIKSKIKKNHITGWKGVVQTSLYPSIGIDDLGSCVRFLIDDGNWTKDTKSGIVTPADTPALKPKREELLIADIQSLNLEKEIRKLVGIQWDEIIKKSAVARKARYS